MMNLRTQFHPGSRFAEFGEGDGGALGGGDHYDSPMERSRFKVLLTEDRDHAIEHWTHQLPRLLGPQGVEAIVAKTGREAIDITSRTDIHAAVIDLATPQDAMNRAYTSSGVPGGIWLLEVLSRLPQNLPIVIVNSRTYTPRQIHRFLHDALRLGAFSVINQPVELEKLLTVIQRILQRQYDGQWPGVSGERN
ncbi:response regulator [Planctomycetota bacterium]|nr:response regulator [Planctomycetota bacterium]